MSIKALYRLYRSIDAQKRLPAIRWLDQASERNVIIRLVWVKLILRYHYLRGHKKGLTIEVTDRCNLKCTYCPKSLDIGVKGSHMSWDIFEKAYRGRLEEGPLDLVNLVGFGEPFLYPDLEKAIRYIKGNDPSTKICVTSNGVLLHPGWGSRLADAGLDQITISVNATSRSQYRRINASEEYDNVVQNTKTFLDEVNRSGSRMTVIIQVMSVLNDEQQIQQFRSFWQPYLGHVGIVQVQPFVNWAGQIDGAGIVLREDEARIAERQKNLNTANLYEDAATTPVREPNLLKQVDKSPFLHDKRQITGESYPCYHLHKTRIISREGNALACCMVYPDDQGDLALGNIRDKSFKNLYLEGRAVELRQIDLQGRLGSIKPCDTCDAWKTVPNIWWKNPFYRWFGSKWL